MFTRRHQENWTIRTNNSILYSSPSEKDIQNIYSFCQNYNDYLSEFVFNAIEMQKNIKYDESFLIVDSQQNLLMIIQILKQQKFIFLDIINETKLSYKGYISYFIIATYNKLYLIDSAKLHDKCHHQLKQVLQKKNLIKFMHQCQEILDCLKRDFQIFMPNIFDLQVVQRYLVKKGKLSVLQKQKFKQYVYGIASHQISLRPAKQELLWRIKEYYQQQMNFLINLDKFCSAQDPEYQCYAYFNHYELLGKSYLHHVYNVFEIDEILQAKYKTKVNPFSQYKKKHQQTNIKEEQFQNLYYVKSQQQQQIAQMIYDWKQHIAKIKDINSQQLLSYQTISKLAKTNITSILQISQIYSTQSTLKQYCLSVQQLEQILQLFNLYKQQKQQKNHQLNIPRRLPFYKTNQQKPIKQLFEQLKFTDLGNDWLNKKNDQSLKLYKQIVSISQFDNSIVEQYLNQTQSNQKAHQQNLSVQNINKYVKYAQYLRYGNHKKLQELYQYHKNKFSSNETQLYEENFIYGQQFIGNDEFQFQRKNNQSQSRHIQQFTNKNWEDIQNQMNFPTMDTINQIKSTESLTSLNNRSTNTIFSCKVLPNPKQSRILKQNKLNSLNLIQSPIFQNKIQALPQNIQSIYLQAAKAKKIYGNKGLKKNNKTGKKQNKNNVEPIKGKKEEQFVPKKQEIFNLIHY